MSLEKEIRGLVAKEIASAIAPLAKAISQLQRRDLGVELAALLSGRAPKRGPGRPPKRLGSRATPPSVRRGPGRPKSERRACAVKGCKRPFRSKGYCAAHYQKFRSLQRTGRLPADWKPNAAPHTVKDIKLPRGRAGAKAREVLKRKAK
jgi:hypothetical protein